VKGTASFNFTKAAKDKNAENLLVINDKALPGNTGKIGRRTHDILRSMWAGDGRGDQHRIRPS
jgi:phosphatidylserine/phosphatidylglycerophosphate/cardiolipin synthase-like enzyme